MIDTQTAYSIVVFTVAYACWFFFVPYRIAELWWRDDMPVHEIMHHFRYWERRRVWISVVGFGACVLSVSLPAASAIPGIALFVGLISLSAADAFQTLQLSRDLPRWSPSPGIGPNGGKMGRVLDLLFGKKPTSDGEGK